MQSRRPAPVSRPSGMAGRSSIKSLSVRNVLAGSDEAGPGVVPDAAPRRMLVNARHSWVGDACLARGEDAPGQTPGAQTPREIGAGAMTVSAPPTHHGGACALSETP